MNTLATSIVWMGYIVSLYFSVFLFLVYLDKRSLFHNSHSTTTVRRYPLVSILVPAYNEEETILKTLESIYRLDYPKDKLQVIVINDGSRDKTEQIVQEYINDKPHFQLLSHSNQGKAASLNRGLEIAKGEFFACLDADSFVDTKTLRKMIALHEEKNDERLAIITPAMKVDQPRNLLQKIQWLEYIVIILIARLVSYLDSLYVAPGPFSLYRTEIIRKLGGFDEQSMTEDQEIAYRVQQHHYRITQCVDGYVHTTAPQRLKAFYFQRRRWYLGSMICVHQYRSLIANRKYGDFGMMQMVKNALGYILAIAGIIIAVYLLVIPLWRWMKDLFLVKFNIIPYITSLSIKFDIMQLLLLDFKKIFIIGFLVGLGFFFFYLAHVNAREKMTKWGWFPLVPYAAFYYLLKGAILLLCLVEFSRGKKIRW
ncbi:TPA: glycosyltransferase family 2 protein [Candidatus Woesearchaeota archaeon]|nr:glycosyltransferase family 2 protein [Candidatus Woesearchaeota archaeon]